MVTKASVPDLIICVGNPQRGDDGVGWAVADALTNRLPPHVHLMRVRGETTDLLDAWSGATHVVLVDAILSQFAPVGTIYRFDAIAEELPRDIFCCSTHGWGVAEAVALGRVLGRLPQKLTIYGVEGHDFRHGVALSTRVAQAIPELVERILREFSKEEESASPSPDDAKSDD